MDATALATLWVFIALLVFLGIVAYLGVFGRIIAAVDARGEKIRAQLDEARRLREEARTLLADYQRRQTEAETEANAIVEQARREAAALAAEAKTRTEDYVRRRTRAAETRIRQAEQQAVAEVKARAIEIATSAVSDVLRQRADGPESARLTREAIERTVRHLN